MLEITVWDVEHGSATYIRTPNNRHVAVDLGDNGKKFSPLQELYARGVQRLDAVVITHPHRDHMDDIVNFAWLAPQTLWTPRHLTETVIRKGNRAEDADVVTRYLELREQYSAAITPATDITAQDVFGGAAFHVFGSRFCDLGNLNNHSLVVVVAYAGLRMVIPGDNESPSWKELLLDPNFVAAVRGADVLLAAHHGRDAGYCPELFEAMGRPKLVVVSDGRFGDTSATDRYSKQATGWKVFDPTGLGEVRNCLTTRSDGHITIALDWSMDPNYVNSLNVRTTKSSMYRLLAQVLGNLR